jgi:hypothetical protein
LGRRVQLSPSVEATQPKVAGRIVPRSGRRACCGAAGGGRSLRGGGGWRGRKPGGGSVCVGLAHRPRGQIQPTFYILSSDPVRVSQPIR